MEHKSEKADSYETDFQCRRVETCNFPVVNHIANETDEEQQPEGGSNQKNYDENTTQIRQALISGQNCIRNGDLVRYGPIGSSLVPAKRKAKIFYTSRGTAV